MSVANQSRAPPELYQISEICDGVYLSGIFPLSDNSVSDSLKSRKIGLIVSCLAKNDALLETHRIVTKTHPEIACMMVTYSDNLAENLWRSTDGGGATMTMNNWKRSSYLTELYTMAQSSEGISAIESAYRAIEIAVSHNVGVLVHCAAGVSRSVSVVCYYLMTRYAWDYARAIAYIRENRSIAMPNQEFQRQLMEYHRWLAGSQRQGIHTRSLTNPARSN